MRKLVSYLRLVLEYVRLNLRAQLEYRGAFISQVLAMALNDCMWLAFWYLFFNRFPALRGWTLNDVITMWCIAAAGFGLAFVLCGNALHLASLIVKGQLDAWMLYPRALLPHLLLGKMNAVHWGDILFGFCAYLCLIHPDLLHLLSFTLLVVSSGIACVGFSILSGSLGFFMGNAEILVQQWRFGVITAATYPATLFNNSTKLILFTVIPAAFVSYLPVEALRQNSLVIGLLSLLGSLTLLAAGTIVFYFGLRRYESGNLAEMRG